MGVECIAFTLTIQTGLGVTEGHVTAYLILSLGVCEYDLTCDLLDLSNDST